MVGVRTCMCTPLSPTSSYLHCSFYLPFVLIDCFQSLFLYTQSQQDAMHWSSEGERLCVAAGSGWNLRKSCGYNALEIKCVMDTRPNQGHVKNSEKQSQSGRTGLLLWYVYNHLQILNFCILLNSETGYS